MLVNSSHRNNPDQSTTNFSVNLTNAIRVKMVRLKMFSIPLCFHNITVDNCNFTYTIDTSPIPTTFAFSIVVGKYTIESLLTTLNGLLYLNANYDSGVVSVAYKPPSGLISATLTPSIDTPINGSFTIGGSLAVTLGFDVLQAGVFTIIAGSYPAFIHSHDYFKLTLSYLDGNIVSVNNDQISTTFIIENTVNNVDDYMGKRLFIDNINEDTGGKNHVFNDPIHLQNFTISVRNSENDVVDIRKLNWWCVIEFLCENENDKLLPNSNVVKLNSSNSSNSSRNNLPLWLRQ